MIAAAAARATKPWGGATAGRALAAALLIGGLLPACGGAGPSGPPPTWTVLVYLDGDNSLSAAAAAELQDVAAAQGSPDVHVLVQLDLPGRPALRYRIVNGVAQQEGADLGELDMSAPATLTDFIRWGAQAAPADHVALILWDHGNGWDEHDGPQPPLEAATARAGRAHSILVDWDNGGARAGFTSNAKVAAAIRDAGVHLDVLGFDACFMGSFEALYEFRGAADDLVASEEDEPDQGWDYRTLLSRLAADPAMTPEQFAGAAVDTYRRWAEDVYGPARPLSESHRLTLVAFRSAALERVATEVDGLAATWLELLGEPATREATTLRLAEARREVQEIDAYVTPGVYVDLADLARLLAPSSAVPARLAEATIDAYHGAARPRASGASIVFFRDRAQVGYDPNYRDWDPATRTGNAGAFLETYRWDELLAAYYDAAGS